MDIHISGTEINSYNDLFFMLDEKNIKYTPPTSLPIIYLAKIQLSLFNKYNDLLGLQCMEDKYNTYLNLLKNDLNKFINEPAIKSRGKNSDLGIVEPIDFDLESFYSKEQKDLNNIINKYLDENLFKKYSKEITPINPNCEFKALFYGYIIISKNGLVCGVGRSHLKYQLSNNSYCIYGNDQGDLFLNINENEGIAKLIKELSFTESKDIKIVDNKVKSFYKTAIIFPLIKCSVERDASNFETDLGEWLKKNYIPILHTESHKHY